MVKEIAAALAFAVATIATSAAHAADVSLQSLLNTGYAVVAGDPTAMVLQKGNSVYVCFPSQANYNLMLCRVVH